MVTKCLLVHCFRFIKYPSAHSEHVAPEYPVLQLQFCHPLHSAIPTVLHPQPKLSTEKSITKILSLEKAQEGLPVYWIDLLSLYFYFVTFPAKSFSPSSSCSCLMVKIYFFCLKKVYLSLIIDFLSTLIKFFCFRWLADLKLLKDGEWLQSDKWSLMAIPFGLTFFSVKGEVSISSPTLKLSCLTFNYTISYSIT